MTWEEMVVDFLSGLFQPSTTINLILILLIIFLLYEAKRLLNEHRDMRRRLTELEAKILAYENIGIMKNIYKEMRGELHANSSGNTKKK